MLRKTVAIGTLILVTSILIPQVADAADPPEELGSQTVAAAIDPETQTATVEGNINRPGHSPAPDSKPKGHGHSTTPIANVHAPARDTRTRTLGEKFTDCDTLWDLQARCVPAVQRPADAPESEDPRATQPITITDLATFAPAPATITGEPDNLGVAGLPTNFTTSAAAHTRSGELFGYPITVRFTPVSFTFHYGDGATKTTKTPGTSWDALHLPQFSPTDTSHVYRDRGTYTASADTVYTAEIDLGTGWFPITGTLTIPGPAQDIRIYEAHTALVAHTCNEDPHAAGC